MAIITWDKNSASAAKWAIIGLVVVVLILIAVAALVKKGPAQDVRKMAYSNVDLESFNEAFTKECPDISTCPMEQVSSFIGKYIDEGIPVDQIPRSFELRTDISARIAAQKSNLVTVKNFWENLDTLSSGIALGLLSHEDQLSWIDTLVSYNSADFCSRLYDLEPDKNPDVILGRDREGYGYFCHVKWIDTIYTLIYTVTQKQGNIDFFKDSPDYEIIKAKLCRDISKFATKTDYFNYLYGYGWSYVRQYRFCNIPLPESEVARIRELVNGGTRTDPEEEAYRQAYATLV